MLEKALRWLAGRPADPTEGWPVLAPQTPPIDLFRGAVGSLAFGAPLADAEVLGRPDRLRWTQPRYCELLYGAAGLQLDFDEGRLAYAAFFLAPDPLAPAGVRCCTARLSGGLALSGASTLDEVRAALGEPSSRDEDGDERIFTYERDGLTLEVEATSRGTLKRLNAYPSGPRPG